MWLSISVRPDNRETRRSSRSLAVWKHDRYDTSATPPYTSSRVVCLSPTSMYQPARQNYRVSRRRIISVGGTATWNIATEDTNRNIHNSLIDWSTLCATRPSNVVTSPSHNHRKWDQACRKQTYETCFQLAQKSWNNFLYIRRTRRRSCMSCMCILWYDMYHNNIIYTYIHIYVLYYYWIYIYIVFVCYCIIYIYIVRYNI